MTRAGLALSIVWAIWCVVSTQGTYQVTFPLATTVSHDAGTSVFPPGTTISINGGSNTLPGIFSFGTVQTTPSCFRAEGGENSLAGAVTENDYVGMSITTSGVRFVLKEIRVSSAKGGPSNDRGFGFRTSKDNFASDVYSSLTTTSFVEYTIPWSTTQGVNGDTSLDIRLYVFASGGTRTVGFTSLKFIFESQCANPPTPPTGGSYPNGPFNPSYPAPLSCGVGFAHDATPDQICHETLFTGTAPLCTAATCSPYAPASGLVTTNCQTGNLGQHCTLSCQNGYNPSGNSDTVCNGVGAAGAGTAQWQASGGGAFVCTVIASSSSRAPSSSSRRSSSSFSSGGGQGGASSSGGGGNNGGTSGGGGGEASGAPVAAIAAGAGVGGALLIGLGVFVLVRRRRSADHSQTTKQIKRATDKEVALMEEGKPGASEGAAAASTEVVPPGGADASAAASAAAAAKKEKEAADKAERAENARKKAEAARAKAEAARTKDEEAKKKKAEEDAQKKADKADKEAADQKKKADDAARKEEEQRRRDEDKRAQQEEEKLSHSPKAGSSPGAMSINSLLDQKPSTSSMVGSSSLTPKGSAVTSTVLVGVSGFPLLPASTVDKRSPDSLRWVLSDRASLTTFVEFLQKELSDENILFYMAVESYRTKFRAHQTAHPTLSTMQVAKALERDAAAIFKQYLQTTSVSSRNINLPEDVNSRLVKNLRAFHTTGQYVDIVKPENDSRESWPIPQTRTPFDEPQEVIYKLMENDSLRRFLKSDEGKEAMSKAGVHA